MSDDLQLTAKQEAFCLEYLVDFNGTRAAIAAGYSAKNAASQATENQRKPNVQKRLATLRQKHAAALEVTAQDAIGLSGALATVSITDVASWDAYDDGTLRIQGSASLPPRVAAAIKKIKWQVDRIDNGDDDPIIRTKVELEMHDKLKAIDQLHRIHDSYAEAQFEGAEVRGVALIAKKVIER